MDIHSINNGVATEISNIDISSLTILETEKVKDCLHKNLILVIKNQSCDSYNYTKFIEGLGNVANYIQMIYNNDGTLANNPGEPTDMWTNAKNVYPVQRVTGKKVDGKRSGIFGSGVLDWHANLNGLNRADGVALQGYEHCKNTSTSFLNTNLAYLEMPDDLRNDIDNVYAEYEYAPEVWAKGLPDDQLNEMKGYRPDISNNNLNTDKYKMWLIQQNVKGIKGLYFYTNNKCKIITNDNTLYDRLHKHVFQEKYIYQHWWNPGDIVVTDQLLTLHKRDQNDPEILQRRVLHRITFRISNYDNYIEKMNKGL